MNRLTKVNIERDAVVRGQARAGLGAHVAEIQRLDNIGREISARVRILDKLGSKAVDMVDSIDCLLKEAEQLCDPEAFAHFKQRWCPQLGQSRTYELLAIRDGRKSLEEIRAATRARVAKHRATKKDVTEKDSVTSLPAKVKVNGQPVTTADFSPAAQAQIVTALVEKQVEDVIANLPVSWDTVEESSEKQPSDDADASAEKRKAEYATADDKVSRAEKDKALLDARLARSAANKFHGEIGKFLQGFKFRFRAWFEKTKLPAEAKESLHNILMLAADELMTLAQEVDGRGADAEDKAAA